MNPISTEPMFPVPRAPKVGRAPDAAPPAALARDTWSPTRERRPVTPEMRLRAKAASGAVFVAGGISTLAAGMASAHWARVAAASPALLAVGAVIAGVALVAGFMMFRDGAAALADYMEQSDGERP